MKTILPILLLSSICFAETDLDVLHSYNNMAQANANAYKRYEASPEYLDAKENHRDTVKEGREFVLNDPEFQQAREDHHALVSRYVNSSPKVQRRLQVPALRYGPSYDYHGGYSSYGSSYYSRDYRRNYRCR